MKITTSQEFVEKALSGSSFAVNKNMELHSTSGSTMARFGRAVLRLSGRSNELLTSSKVNLQKAMLDLVSPAGAQLTALAPPSERVFPGLLARQVLDHVLSQQVAAGTGIDPKSPVIQGIFSHAIAGNKNLSRWDAGILKTALEKEFQGQPFLESVNVETLQRQVQYKLEMFHKQLCDPGQMLRPDGTLSMDHSIMEAHIDAMVQEQCARNPLFDQGQLRDSLVDALKKEVNFQSVSLPALLGKHLSEIVRSSLAQSAAQASINPDSPDSQRMLQTIVGELGIDAQSADIIKWDLEKNLANFPPQILEKPEELLGVLRSRARSVAEVLNDPGLLSVADDGALAADGPVVQLIIRQTLEGLGADGGFEELELLTMLLEKQFSLYSVKAEGNIVNIVREHVNELFPRMKLDPESSAISLHPLLTTPKNALDTKHPVVQRLIDSQTAKICATNPRLDQEALKQCVIGLLNGKLIDSFNTSLPLFIGSILAKSETLWGEFERLRLEGLEGSTLSAQFIHAVLSGMIADTAQNAHPDLPQRLLDMIISSSMEGLKITGGENLFDSQQELVELAVMMQLSPQLVPNRGRFIDPESEVVGFAIRFTEQTLPGDWSSALRDAFRSRLEVLLGSSPVAILPGPLFRFAGYLSNILASKVESPAANGFSLYRPEQLILSALTEQAIDDARGNLPGYPGEYFSALSRTVMQYVDRGQDTNLESAAKGIQSRMKGYQDTLANMRLAASRDGTFNPQNSAVRAAVYYAAGQISDRNPALSPEIVTQNLFLAISRVRIEDAETTILSTVQAQAGALEKRLLSAPPPPPPRRA